MIGSIRAFLQTRATSEAWKSLLKDTVQTEVFRQGAAMSFWRILSLAFATVASIWAARCLGPENLGISAMIISTMLQLSLLVNFNHTPLLVRLYKHRPTKEAQNELIATVFTFRRTASAALIVLTVPLLLCLGLSPKWYLGILAGIPFFLLLTNLADWILQSEGQMAEYYKALTAQALVTASLYLFFFRPGIGPGYDVAVQALGMLVSSCVAWHFATRGRSKFPLYQWHLLPKIVPILYEGRWIALSGFVGYINNGFESPLLGYLSSIKELGIYRTATVLITGVSALLSMISALLYPRYIDWKKQGDAYLWSRQKKISLVFAALFLPLIILAFLLSPLFFYYVYSPVFARAAYPFAILLTARFVGVINGIYYGGLLAHRQDKSMLVITSTVSFICLGLNLLLIPHFGVMAAASVNLTNEFLVLTATFTLNRRLVHRQTLVA